jgi:hypothetical protein
MLPLISILAGTSIVATFSLWLWYMLARPAQWAKFTEKDNAFWVRRGLPVKWAEACKRFEQGKGLKILNAVTILMSGILTLLALLVHFTGIHHG